jgi:spore germination protein
LEIYVIRPGDTLFAIARRFGVSLSSLININQLVNPEELIIGQAILIPTPQPEPLRYRVTPGDTLFQIAQTFNTTVAAIVQTNQIPDPDRIQAGAVLTIPGWSQATYTVRAGDTLYQIAAGYGTSINLIAKVNQISDPSRIFPGQTLIIPQPSSAPLKTVIETMGYFHFTNLNGLARSLAVIGPYITYGGLFQYPISATGQITVPPNTQQAVNILNNNNVQPLLTLTNWGPEGFESDLARAIMGDPAVKARAIENILQLLDGYGFSGINIDFENMYPEDRGLFNAFVKDLRDALRPRNYLISIAVPPKAADLPNSPWVGTFDYRALGELADFIFLMTYEWGWVGGPPMAIAPINQVRRTLDYAVTQIPRDKILQGVPFYGYNWQLPDTPENVAIPVNLVEVYSLAYRFQASINYDTIAQAPWFRYTDGSGADHEVWFEDLRSMDIKYDTAIAYNLRGVGWWSYINEPYGFPQNWLIMDEKFIINKN